MNFRCLAIETATSRCSVAACSGDRIEQRWLDDRHASSRQIYRSVQEVLAAVGLAPAQLDCVAFGRGPGGFTGVRIAVAAAQGIAFAHALPVCGVSTLATMAVAAGTVARDKTVAVCLDARQGEVYFGLYHCGADGQPEALQADALLRPADLVLGGASGSLLAVGNGWSEWPDLQMRHRASLSEVLSGVWPDALSLLAIARVRFTQGGCLPAVEALPNYVRNQVTQ